MNRSFDLLYRLLHLETSITIRELAEEFQVSEKSVRNDLLSLDSLVARYQLNIVRKPGLGVLIEGDYDHRIRMLEYIRSQQQPMIYSSNERLSKLLLRFLSSDEPILIKELSLDYHVSRTTISNDVILLNETLKDYELNIVYKLSEGLLMEGNEANKRKAMSMVLPYDTEHTRFETPLNSQAKLTNQLLTRLNAMLDVDLGGLEEILHDAEHLLGYTFSTEAFINLVIHLGIAIHRSQSGNPIVLGDDVKEKLRNYAEYDIAMQTARTIEKTYQIKFEECEVYYILLHFLGAKTMEHIVNIDFKITLEQTELEEAVTTFIQRMQVELQVVLEFDVQLFNSLLLHLRPTINRMVYGLSLHNPLKTEIIQNYPEIYRAIQTCVSVLDDAYHIHLPEDELTYLVLHFAAAMERLVRNTRVLIACASGIGMSQLLVARIERLFKNIDIVATVSILEIDKYTKKQIDLIISTVNIGEVPGIKTIVVSPLLSEIDISKIRSSLIHRNDMTFNKQRFQAAYVFDVTDKWDKPEVLMFINKQLLQHKKVSKSYLNSMKKREGIGSTYIGFGIAVVHGDIKEVFTSCLQVLRLSHPIVWDESNQVDFVINFAATEHDADVFASLFTQIGIHLDDDAFWSKVKSTNDKHELCLLLNKELLYDYK